MTDSTVLVVVGVASALIGVVLGFYLFNPRNLSLPKYDSKYEVPPRKDPDPLWNWKTTSTASSSSATMYSESTVEINGEKRPMTDEEREAFADAFKTMDEAFATMGSAFADLASKTKDSK